LGANQQDELIAYFDRLFNELDAEPDDIWGYAFDGFLSTATWCLRNMSVISKHPGFSEEREWRALYWPYDSGEESALITKVIGPQALRMRDEVEIPYHEWLFAGRDDAIAEVIIGPKSPASIDDVSNLLKSQGFVEFDVYRSDIPYR